MIKMIKETVDRKLLQQAVKVLRDLNAKYYGDSSKKKPLLEDEKQPTLYLQITLKKIPKCKKIKMIKINLPHSLVKDNSEVCLITGDLDKRNHKAEIEPDILHYKELLKKHGIDNISEVVTLRQLRTEYKPYEAKQKLLAAYDLFLADRKILECLPRVLGRHFYRKRRFPIPITLNTQNLKQQVEKALSTKVFYLTAHGNSCTSEVAFLDMPDKDISENVMEVLKAFCDKLPGSWDNVMGIYLKTALSKAVPVYMSYDNPNLIQLEEEKNDNSFEMDELSTCPNSLVKVYKDGRIRVKRLAEDETEETTDVSGESSKKKQKKDDSTNIDNTDDINDEVSKVLKTRKRKKEKNSLANAVVKEETTDVSGESSKKKQKKDDSTNIDNTDDINDEVSKVLKTRKRKKEKNSLANAVVKEEPTEIKKTTKNKKGNIIMKEEADSFFKEEKEEYVEVKKETKKKKENVTIKEETDNFLKKEEESSESIAKSKKKRKSDGSILLTRVCDSISKSESKGKLRKRRSVL